MRSPGAITGMPGGYGATSPADPPGGPVERDRLRRGEEPVAGRDSGDGLDAVARRADDRTGLGTMSLDRPGDGLSERRDGLGDIGERDDGDEDVAIGGHARRARGQEVLLDRIAVGPGARQDQRELERVDGGSVEDDEAVEGAQPVACVTGSGDRLAEQVDAVALE